MRTVQRRILLASAYLVLYLLLEWASYARPMLAPGITPWHPQSGVTLAFLAFAGPAWCPVTALGALLSQVLLRPAPVSVAASLLAATWMALVFALLAGVTRRLLPRMVPESASAAARFVIASGALTLLGACGYVGSYVLLGQVLPADALRGISRYWLADLNGVLMLAPLLLLGGPRAAMFRALSSSRLEISAYLALVAVLLAIIFALPGNEQLRFFYLLFVPVIWIALRWDWRGALPALLLIQAGLILGAEAALHTPRFIDTQLLMLTLTLTALLLGSVVDERRRSQQQLRERDAELARAMRFAVAGELASATGHELNQPLTALVSYLGSARILAAMPAADPALLRDTVRKAADEALRASDVLHRLRDFYLGGALHRDEINAAAVVRAVVGAFAERLQRSQVTLDVFVQAPSPKIIADETQLQIVLHNLIGNAIEAAAERAPADRRIEVWVSAEAQHLLIEVEDSGGGVSPGVAARLFEPFVTSKPDGMGLGLAISRSLVRAHGGEIVSEPPRRLRGARLCVSLPLAATAPGGDR